MTQRDPLDQSVLPLVKAPEVELPRKTIPGSIGCLSAFVLCLLLIGLAMAHFYSMGNYSTRLNIDGTYHFSGKVAGVEKVLFSDRYKLVIDTTANEKLTLPPVPSPVENDVKVMTNLATGLCIDGDLTVKHGFLRDLSLKLGDRQYHFDTDAGWVAALPVKQDVLPVKQDALPGVTITPTEENLLTPPPEPEAPEKLPDI